MISRPRRKPNWPVDNFSTSRCAGLLGAWYFNMTQLTQATGSIPDLSGNGFNGTLVLAAGTVPQWVQGKRGWAVTPGSDGVLSTVDFGTRFAQFERDQPFTIIVDMNSPTIATQQAVFNNQAGVGGGFRGWSVEFFGGAPAAILYSTTGTNGAAIIATQALASATDYTIAYTYDGSSTTAGQAIYVNGQRQSVNVLQNNLSATTVSAASTKMGVRDSAGIPFTGSISRALIYSRCLSAGEAALDYLQPDAPFERRASGIFAPKVGAVGGRSRFFFGAA